MNKLSTLVALVAFVGVVAATKLHHLHHDGLEEAEAAGLAHLGHGHFGHHGLEGGLHGEEFLHHGHRFPSHLSHGEGFGHSGLHNRLAGQKLRHALRKRHNLRRPIEGVGVGGAGAAGAAGGAGTIAGAEGRLGASGLSEQRLAAGKSAQLGALAQGSKTDAGFGAAGVEAAGGAFSNEDDGGFHKHQVLNRDKTIVKDHVGGVNDVDSFHHHNSNAIGGQVKKGVEGGRFSNREALLAGGAGFNEGIEGSSLNEGSIDGSLAGGLATGGAGGVGGVGAGGAGALL